MTGKSHALIGAAVGYFLGGPVAIPFSTVGALLPDIDEPNSTISRVIFPKGSHSKSGRILFGILLVILAIYLKLNYLVFLGMGVLALAFISHRGVLHSPVFLGFMATLALHQFGDLGNYFYLFVGYLSHILADSLTVSGIPMLYPLTKKKYGLRLIKTDTISEYLVLTFILVGIFYCV